VDSGGSYPNYECVFWDVSPGPHSCQENGTSIGQDKGCPTSEFLEILYPCPHAEEEILTLNDLDANTMGV